jgi:hypothetical protein
MIEKIEIRIPDPMQFSIPKKKKLESPKYCQNMSYISLQEVPIVPSKRGTSFDEMKFSYNSDSNGSLPSGSHDRCNISIPKDEQLVRNH